MSLSLGVSTRGLNLNRQTSSYLVALEQHFALKNLRNFPICPQFVEVFFQDWYLLVSLEILKLLQFSTLLRQPNLHRIDRPEEHPPPALRVSHQSTSTRANLVGESEPNLRNQTVVWRSWCTNGTKQKITKKKQIQVKWNQLRFREIQD